MKFTGKVNEFVDKYPDLDNVAAICVYPNMAEVVNDTLEADHVNIACVSGGFPSSQTFTEVKVAETAMALHTGADEIDIVIPVGKFLSGDYEGMCDEIEELKAVKDGEDLEGIKAKTESLTQAFYKISEELYKAQAQQGGAEGTEHHDEDVVDADYEVVDDEENK